MKHKIFTILLIILSALTVAQAQDKKSKKNKLKEQPKLAIVQIEEPPLPTPTVTTVDEIIKPANGSLFSDSMTSGNLFRDFKARQLGDLVFIDIDETSTATVTSGANRARDSGTVGGVVTAAGALPVPGAAIAGTIVGALGKRNYEGNGATQRKSTINARITARVVEVLPNGDLRIQALKLVRINKETEQVAVTGIIRPNDLAADNSVPTVLIGDLRVEFNGKGVASADNTPGWLFRLFDKFSPF
jgi:flagellar L-ring protein precursor FlgH